MEAQPLARRLSEKRSEMLADVTAPRWLRTYSGRIQGWRSGSLNRLLQPLRVTDARITQAPRVRCRGHAERLLPLALAGGGGL